MTDVRWFPIKQNQYAKWEVYKEYDYAGTAICAYEIRIATFEEGVDAEPLVPKLEWDERRWAEYSTEYGKSFAQFITYSVSALAIDKEYVKQLVESGKVESINYLRPEGQAPVFKLFDRERSSAEVTA